MTTKLLHAGVGASSLESADRFYADLLGLCRSTTKELSAEQCRMLFGIDSSMLMVHYRGPGTDFEVFAYSSFSRPSEQVTHSCLEVAGRDAFVASCRTAGLRVIELPKGDRVLFFVHDFDGNLFEIVETTV